MKQTCTDIPETIEAVAKGKYRQKYHIMPPMGWMNDPNGLCKYGNEYHIFFQYSPDSPKGALKTWGHYVTKDFVTMEYRGIALKPDIYEDKDGVYSGSAFTGDGKMELFYTGNSKDEGDYDYVYAGRNANVVYVTSEDGTNFSDKTVVMTNKDYPSDYTCHIRDPKVWKENETYYMVQGGRKNAPEIGDKGAILLFSSKDKLNWKFEKEVTTKERFGFMWECPDFFAVDGVELLSFCPQGIEREKYRHYNGDLSGCFVTKDLWNGCGQNGTIVLDNPEFFEWDKGFEFYAPQTFADDKDRRILIGWVGIPNPQYTNEATIKEGWQHCLTVPREIKVDKQENGNVRILQNPISEVEQLRERKVDVSSSEVIIHTTAFDAEITFVDGKEEKSIFFNEDLEISYQNGEMQLTFHNETGEGRQSRFVKMEEVYSIRILMDVSVMEVYINGGEVVLTTRYYPKDTEKIKMKTKGFIKKNEIWEMGTLR